MNEHEPWLLAELERWESDGLVSVEQAGRLRTRYSPAAGRSDWGILAFAGAGAVVLGLGVILLFAFNWDAIPKWGKLGLVFGAVTAAHVLGLNLQRRLDWRRGLGAAVSFLGTMFFGAGIWLVAQVYHFDEHYTTGFLIWAIAALAMAWALDSMLHGLLATVLTAIWVGGDVFSFKDPQFWAWPALAVAILPLAWRLRSAALLAVALSALQFLLLVNLYQLGTSWHMLTASLAWGAFLIAAARAMAAPRVGFAAGARVGNFFGFLTVVFCTYFLSFPRSWAYGLGGGGYYPQSENEFAWLYTWVLFALAIAAWIGVIITAVRQRFRGMSMDAWLVPVILGQTYGLVWGHVSLLGLKGVYPFNLLLLGLAVAWTWQGCRDRRRKPVALGLLIVAALVIARYFDLFFNLASRGTAFAILGVVLVVLGLWFRRRQARLDPEAIS